MQVSIDVQDDLYEKVLSRGIDMQSEFNEYLRTQIETNIYRTSSQFQKDKVDLQEALAELQSGKVKALSHEEVWEDIENYSQEN